MGRGGLLGVIALVWLLIGVFAVWQRGYFAGGQATCATAGTIALVVITGPLNYAGVDPKVRDCHMPRPSAMAARGVGRVNETEPA